jgi:two-component system, sensor histidine kinase YesM
MKPRRFPALRFQTRLLLTYGVFVLVLIVSMSLSFYRYHARFLEERARETYKLIGERIARQLDDLFNSMDFVLINLVSDGAFRESLVTLNTAPRDVADATSDIEMAARTISRSLAMHSLYRAQLDVIVNTAAGDLFSSNFLDHRRRRGAGSWGTVPAWRDEVLSADGPPVVVGPFPDPWVAVRGDRLFGVARSIRGASGSIAIVGSYQSTDTLEAILTSSVERGDREPATVLAFTNEGVLLHASPPVKERFAGDYADVSVTDPGFSRYRDGGGLEFVAVSSMPSGWGRVVVVVDRSVLVDALSVTQALIGALGVAVFVVSVAYTWFSSRTLTRPLRMIEADIEATDLQNLGVGPPLEHDNDELVALDRAFNRLKSRLELAVGREVTAQTAAMQARMDSLQAQMNPHFLYNTLTVIANRGIELGDTAIGEMCDGLSSMLRYATATTRRSATMREEIDHVRAYLFLMSQRLESRLHAEVKVSADILDARMPKIVIQQLVENSISHGYADSAAPVELEIRGSMEGEWWHVTVSDGGTGFAADRLNHLREQMSDIDREVREDRTGVNFEIGGLGILNTYTRMALFYGGRFRWVMSNRPDGGAVVEISAPMAFEVRSDA